VPGVPPAFAIAVGEEWTMRNRACRCHRESQGRSGLSAVQQFPDGVAQLHDEVQRSRA